MGDMGENFNAMKDHNKKTKMQNCPYNLNGYCFAYNRKCSKNCYSKQIEAELNERKKTNESRN